MDANVLVSLYLAGKQGFRVGASAQVVTVGQYGAVGLPSIRSADRTPSVRLSQLIGLQNMHAHSGLPRALFAVCRGWRETFAEPITVFSDIIRLWPRL